MDGEVEESGEISGWDVREWRVVVVLVWWMRSLSGQLGRWGVMALSLHAIDIASHDMLTYLLNSLLLAVLPI